MDFISKPLADYAEDHSDPEPEVLKELSRETHLNVLMPRMLSGHLQGRLLAFVSRLVNPVRILEIGTYTGYSAICMGEGLQKDGKLHTIEINEELKDFASRYFEKAGMKEKIIQHIGDATKIIPTLKETFDLVFIDADKENYPLYFDLVFDKVREGGIILVDNVLWSGKILDKKELIQDKDTQSIDHFNKKVRSDSRVSCILLPVRDGLMLIQKNRQF